MKKYIYRNKKTGKKIYSEVELTDKDLVMVSIVRDGMIKSNDSRIIKK